MRFQQYVTISAALRAAMKFHPAGHVAEGQEARNARFVLAPEGGSEGEMFPLIIKVSRDNASGEPCEVDLPKEGIVYKMILTFEKGKYFVDGRTGRRCRSRDLWVVHLYPRTKARSDGQPWTAQGELNLEVYDLGEELMVHYDRKRETARGRMVEDHPSPWTQRFEGTHRKGALWLAEPGVEYRVNRRSVAADSVFFTGPVLVEMNGTPSIEIPGAIRYDLNGATAVYDRRRDRLSSFARAEVIDRKIDGKDDRRRFTFRFVNLRDIGEEEVADSPPEWVINSKGLERIAA